MIMHHLFRPCNYYNVYLDILLNTDASERYRCDMVINESYYIEARNKKVDLIDFLCLDYAYSKTGTGTVNGMNFDILLKEFLNSDLDIISNYLNENKCQNFILKLLFKYKENLKLLNSDDLERLDYFISKLDNLNQNGGV